MSEYKYILLKKSKPEYNDGLLTTYMDGPLAPRRGDILTLQNKLETVHGVVWKAGRYRVKETYADTINMVISIYAKYLGPIKKKVKP